jgi:hypothetical protein
MIEFAERGQALGQLADGLQLLVADDAVRRRHEDHDVNERRLMADGFHMQCHPSRAVSSVASEPATSG